MLLQKILKQCFLFDHTAILEPGSNSLVSFCYKLFYTFNKLTSLGACTFKSVTQNTNIYWIPHGSGSSIGDSQSLGQHDTGKTRLNMVWGGEGGLQKCVKKRGGRESSFAICPSSPVQVASSLGELRGRCKETSALLAGRSRWGQTQHFLDILQRKHKGLIIEQLK